MNMDKTSSRYTNAAWEAAQQFPIDVDSIEFVAHSENVTFRVSVRGTESDYVLRLHRPDYNSIAELESERQWVHALGNSGVTVQESLLTKAGAHFVLTQISGTKEQRYAGMTTWLEGVPLSSFLKTCTNHSKRQSVFRRLGEIAATLHNQSTNWQAPSGFVRRRLDYEGLLGESPFWGRFWEHAALSSAERKLVLGTRQSVGSSLREYGESERSFSLIHADLTPDNIVCEGENLAVIDFDDAAFGWHLYDIASILIECRAERDFDNLQAALLEGYRVRREWAQSDTEMLATFLLIRGLAIVGWYHQRPEHADSPSFLALKDWVLNACNAFAGKT